MLRHFALIIETKRLLAKNFRESYRIPIVATTDSNTITLLQAVLMGEELLPIGLLHFSLEFRLFHIERDASYETDKRKFQAICEILARKL